MIGSTISHYRIVEKLGEGGMGVVYKAEDTKLERTVALKFLAQHLLDDAEAKERFLREAKAAAALHHSNVCPVHEIDEADGKTFLAMAFLEGEPLEGRIARGPLSIKDALDIGRQVAEGLEAAHEKGIVHRDIKPANIIVDAKGHATIMDFGLARLTEASRLTKVDTAMGTVAYMSPEQAQGMEVDSRTDIWALGCVLYEMVSGQRPFQGQYDQALLYEIVHEEVTPLTSVRAGVPMELEFIVGKCLAKGREDRYNGADELSKDLRTLGEKLKSGHSMILRTAQMTGAVQVTAGQTLNPAATLAPDAVVMNHRSNRALQALAVVATLAFLATLAIHLAEPQPEKPLRHFSMMIDGASNARISPDGRHIAVTVLTGDDRGIWLRTLANDTTRRLADSEDIRFPPIAWSPDSRSIAFATDSHLRRLEIDGGESSRLCDIPTDGSYRFVGASWSSDGQRIVFSSGLALWEVSALGGAPTLVLERDAPAGGNFVFPHLLPAAGADRLVYSAGDLGNLHVESMDLAVRERRQVADGFRPFYSPSGHILSQTRDGALIATPFSLDTLSPTGDSFPIVESGAWPSTSSDGTLVHIDGSIVGATPIEVRDRQGNLLRTVGEAVGRGDALAISPNGERIAASIDGDIWIFDLSRDNGIRLTSLEGAENRPRWINDEEVSFALETVALATQVADGSEEPTVVLDWPLGFFWFDWSADRQLLVHTGGDPEGGEAGIWRHERATDGSLGEAISFLRTPAAENQPELSPDGRYIAYRSNESGRSEIYVRRFPSAAGQLRISTNGGLNPHWSSDGRELFYRNGTALMTVGFDGNGTPVASRPRMLFEAQALERPASMSYDVFPNGQRFAMFGLPLDERSAPAVHIVENWSEEFRDREN